MGNIVHFHQPAKDITCRADSDLVEGTFVVISGTEVDDLPLVRTAGAGERPYGVVVNSRRRGEDVLITRGGTVPLLAGGTVEPGDAISSDGSGRAVRATAPAHTRTDERATFGTYVAGIATTRAASAELVRGTLTLGA